MLLIEVPGTLCGFTFDTHLVRGSLYKYSSFAYFSFFFDFDFYGIRLDLNYESFVVSGMPIFL